MISQRNEPDNGDIQSLLNQELLLQVQRGVAKLETLREYIDIEIISLFNPDLYVAHSDIPVLQNFLDPINKDDLLNDEFWLRELAFIFMWYGDKLNRFLLACKRHLELKEEFWKHLESLLSKETDQISTICQAGMVRSVFLARWLDSKGYKVNFRNVHIRDSSEQRVSARQFGDTEFGISKMNHYGMPFINFDGKNVFIGDNNLPSNTLVAAWIPTEGKDLDRFVNELSNPNFKGKIKVIFVITDDYRSLQLITPPEVLENRIQGLYENQGLNLINILNILSQIGLLSDDGKYLEALLNFFENKRKTIPELGDICISLERMIKNK